jgi:hypothetical protein
MAAAVRSGPNFYRGRCRSWPVWSDRASRTGINADALDVERSELRTIQPKPRPSMTLTRSVLSDRFGLLGADGGQLAGLPLSLVATYLILRLIIPVILIALATRSATPTQRINLVRAYLIAYTESAGFSPRWGRARSRANKQRITHDRSDAP